MNYKYDFMSEKEQTYNKIKTILQRAGELISTRGLILISYDADWKASYSFYDFVKKRVILYYSGDVVPNDILIIDEDEDVVVVNKLEMIAYRDKTRFAIDTLEEMCETTGYTVYHDVSENNESFVVIFNPKACCGYGIISCKDKLKYTLSRVEKYEKPTHPRLKGIDKLLKRIDSTELGKHLIELKKLTAVDAITALNIYADEQGRKNCKVCVYNNKIGPKLCTVLFNKEIISKTGLDVCFSGKLQKFYGRDFHEEYHQGVKGGYTYTEDEEIPETQLDSQLELKEEHHGELSSIYKEITELLINAARYR